jgi:hypothetical protein
MSSDTRAGSRILAAQARHCANTAAEWEAARVAGASAEELALCEDRAIAARRRYQELAVDLPHKQQTLRPWWRFLSSSHKERQQ